MAATIGKTPPKGPHDMKKEGTPVKTDGKDRNGGEKDKQDETRPDQRKDNRRDFQNRPGDRFQNRRGGRNQSFNQGPRGGQRGGFHGNRDRSDSQTASIGMGDIHSGSDGHGPAQGRPPANQGRPASNQGRPASNQGRPASNQGHGHGGGGNVAEREHVQQREIPQVYQEDPNSGQREQKKFTGRCRLFVGNITPDTTEEQFKELFTPYGEVSEVFVNAGRGFGFIRMDYRINAERAKLELDGQMRNGRVLRVRFATHGSALKVLNLSPFVSNELLEECFSQFGEVERAVVVVDVRGRSCGEGIVEFARKPGANSALKRINEGVFLLSSQLRPTRVEPVEQRDEEDGLTEKLVQRNEGFRKDREKEPRFAPPGSFEFEFGMKYRIIDDKEREAIERVKKDFDVERQRLVEEMETAVFDYQAEQIRQDLLRQQEELKRLDAMKNEHMRRRQELDMRRQEQMRSQDVMIRQEEERRREDERRREMMMRASNSMNRDGGMGGMSPRSGRPDDMMMRGGPGNLRDSPQRGGGGGGGSSSNQRGSGPGTPPMPPPPVPPGMNMDQPNRERGERFGGMPGNIGGGSPNADRPNLDRPQEMNMNKEQMQRPGPPNQQGGRFPGPPGPGNFPPGMGNMGGPGGNMFPSMPGGMGKNPNMGGNDRRREGGRREEYENSKRMRRY